MNPDETPRWTKRQLVTISVIRAGLTSPEGGPDCRVLPAAFLPPACRPLDSNKCVVSPRMIPVYEHHRDLTKGVDEDRSNIVLLG